MNDTAIADRPVTLPTAPEPAQAAPHSRIHAGMGAIPHAHGVAFRVWAPNADAVSVIGDFNDWNGEAAPMRHEAGGYWYADLAGARIGQGYKFRLVNGDQILERIDPYAREVVNSSAHGVVHDPEFDWQGDAFELPPHNELVIYEMHIGSFNPAEPDRPGSFAEAEARLSHLQRLGVNALQVMPVAEFAGDYSWGYNPANIFAVESAYGGPAAFKRFVRAAHRLGLAVILDVVYNHLGPSDLDLWQFDGWSENGGGGIYFYNDWRAETPWGDTRPDYGRGEVRQYIHDNAMMWLEDFHVDGLRFDMTLYMRSVRGEGGDDLPDGWGLAQWINRDLRARFPGRIAIAEDLRNNDWLTKSPDEGGAGFHAQWDASFVHPVRAAVIVADDAQRSMQAVHDALVMCYDGDAFRRVVYSESHDEVANGKARVPQEVNPDDPLGWHAQKRSALAAALVFTAPGIPMLFQGQEFLQGEWFRDDVPLDWDQKADYHGIVRLYRDLVRLRLNRAGHTRGLAGQFLNVFHVNEAAKLIAFQRWDQHGVGDDVVIVMNFGHQTWDNYEIGLPCAGQWALRFNGDARVYSPEFSDHPSASLIASDSPMDGLAARAALSIAPYSALIYSQPVAGRAAD